MYPPFYSWLEGEVEEKRGRAGGSLYILFLYFFYIFVFPSSPSPCLIILFSVPVSFLLISTYLTYVLNVIIEAAKQQFV